VIYDKWVRIFPSGKRVDHTRKGILLVVHGDIPVTVRLAIASGLTFPVKPAVAKLEKLSKSI